MEGVADVPPYPGEAGHQIPGREDVGSQPEHRVPVRCDDTQKYSQQVDV